MREEFELKRRSKLKTHTSELGDAISTLAANPQARNRFLHDPAAFLNQLHVPVGACSLGTGRVNQTSETITQFVCVDFWVAVCSQSDTDVNIRAVIIGPEPLPNERPRGSVVNLL